MEDDDDDIPQLPADTLAALQEFHTEKDLRTKQFEALKNSTSSPPPPLSSSSSPPPLSHSLPHPPPPPASSLSISLFGEDWNASQFWYTDHTATLLARQLLASTTPSSAIACVSAPSVYIQLRNLLSTLPASAARPKLRLFEYDQRFEVFGDDFVPYDYAAPMKFPGELRAAFDRVICDPPFLSEDCQAKTALTVRALARDWRVGGETRVVECTGERMEGVVLRLYGGVGVRTTTFEPEHAKGLGNEFWCYANFECEDWGFRGGKRLEG